MAEMLIQSENLTAIADKIRVLSGTENAMGLDAMATYVGTANDDVGTQTDLLAQAVAALEGKAGGGSGSGGGSSTVETCTVTLSSTSSTEGNTLIYHTVENGEVIMKTHYFSYSVSLLYPSVTCVKNSFLCWGKSTLKDSTDAPFSISGGIQQISHNIANTCGVVFKITGDCTISIS